MNKNKWDKTPVGALIGLIMPFFGFLLYATYYTYANEVSFDYFIKTVFFGNRIMVAPILSLSLLINIAPFYFFINRNYYKTARGILMSLFIYALIIVYFRFF